MTTAEGHQMTALLMGQLDYILYACVPCLALAVISFWLAREASWLVRCAPTAAFLTILALGWGATEWRGRAVDARMRQDVLRQASQIAQTIDPELVKRLTFTDRDADSPIYERLRKQMIAYGRYAGLRSIYTLAVRDGTLVFGPENLPEGDPMASAPGTIYNEPSEGDWEVFRSRKGNVFGPVTDEYGTFVSGLTPIIDPRTGQVPMAVGIDMLADDWHGRVRAARSGAILATLALATLFGVGAALIWRRERSSRAAQRTWLWHIETGLTAVMCLALTGLSALIAHALERQSHAEDFQRLADARAQVIASAFRDARNDIASVARFIERSDHVSADEFVGFAAPLTQSSAIHCLEWVMRTPAGDGGGAAGVSWPVLYVTPVDGNEAAIGFDLDSEPVRRAAIEKVIASGLPVGTAPLTLVQETGRSKGMLMLHPVHKDGTPSADGPIGFAVGVLRLEAALSRVLIGVGQADDYARLRLLDLAGPGETLAEFPPPLPSENAGPRRSAPPYASASPMFIFGRSWALVVEPGAAFLAGHRPWAGPATATGGALLSLLITASVAVLRNRHASLERQVRERTMALADSECTLRASEAKLHAIVRSIQTGLIIIDAESHRIVDANAAAEQLIGTPREKLVGRGCRSVLCQDRCAGCPATGTTPTAENAEGVLLTIDGERRSILKNATIIEIHGRPHLLVSFVDITQRKRTEESLRKLSRAVEHAPAAIVVTDASGTIEYVNPAFVRATGYAADEAIGRNPRILKSGVMADSVYQEMWQTLAAGHEWRGELQNRRKDGSLFWELAIIAPIKDDQGRTTHYVAVKEEISAWKRLEEELRSAARTDRLTGLPNRALLCDRLEQAIARARRTKDYRFAVLFLDFDRFKIINDSLGHDVGDALLKEIAGRLRRTVRANDSVSRETQGATAARLGGDEFVVLLDGAGPAEDVLGVADRILEALARPYRLQDREIYSSASIGIVTSDMASHRAEDILRDADTAMYEAKMAGKGRYVVFDASMRQRVQERLALESDLRQALAAKQFRLVYQPIINLESRRVESFEALLRWEHPRRGRVSPADFIPVAEECGLIVEIGEWTLREAFGQYRAWRSDRGDAVPPSISVNLSRAQLMLPDLAQRVAAVAAETGFDLSRLHLEITESAVMRDQQAAIRTLRELRELGIKLDLDDFGTGYSSLASLHLFPIDVLKIDRSFIENIGRGRDFAALVQAVAQLARNLGIAVIAEGIETTDQLMMLQALECEFGQGYLFARPLPAAEAIEFRIESEPLITPEAA